MAPTPEDYLDGLIFNDADSGRDEQGPFRLKGFDAPETTHRNKPAEPLAKEAEDYLDELIFSSGGASIDRTGEQGYYGRDLARLRGNDGRDLNAEMVKSGRVTPAGEDYLSEAEFAQQAVNTSIGDNGMLSVEQQRVVDGTRAAEERAFQQRQNGPFVPPTDNSFLNQHRDGTFASAVQRGVDTSQAMYFGFAKSIGDVTDFDVLSEWGEEGLVRNLQEAAANPPEIHSWDDVDSLGAFGTFALEALGEQLPQLLGDAAALLTGAGAASVAARAAFGKALLRKMGRESMNKWAVGRGAAAANIYAQSSGETAVELYQAGVEDVGSTALLTGIPKAALEYAPLGALVSNVKKITGMSGNQLGQVAARIMQQGAIEGTTEGLQTVLDFIAVSHHTGQELFDPERLEELRTAIAKGAIVGSGVTVPGALPPAYRAARDRFLRGEREQEQMPADRAGLEEFTNGLAAGDRVETTEQPGVTITEAEPVSDLQAQWNKFVAGEKGAFFASRANQELFDEIRLGVPDGAKVVETDEGLLVTKSALFNVDKYLRARPEVRDRIRAGLLGYSQTKADIKGPENAMVVQTRDSEGNIVHQEVVDKGKAEFKQAVQELASSPGEVVEVATPAEAIAERQRRVQDERIRARSDSGSRIAGGGGEVPATEIQTQEQGRTSEDRAVFGGESGGEQLRSTVVASPADDSSLQRGTIDGGRNRDHQAAPQNQTEPKRVSGGILSDLPEEAKPLAEGINEQEERRINGASIGGNDDGRISSSRGGDQTLGSAGPGSIRSDGPVRLAGGIQSEEKRGRKREKSGLVEKTYRYPRVELPEYALQLVRDQAKLGDYNAEQILSLFEMFMKEGYDPHLSLEFAVAQQQVGDTQEVEDRNHDDRPFETDTPEIDSYLIGENVLSSEKLSVGEQQELPNHEQVQRELLKKQPLFGLALANEITFQHAKYPTRRFAPQNNKALNSNATSRDASTIVLYERLFKEAVEAELYIDLIQSKYPNSQFEVVKTDSGYIIQQGKLDPALQPEVDNATELWQEFEPKLYDNARKAVNAAKKAEREGDTVRAKNERDKLLEIQIPDGRKRLVHAPTLTEFGMRLFEKEGDLGPNLEVQFASLADGLSTFIQKTGAKVVVPEGTVPERSLGVPRTLAYTLEREPKRIRDLLILRNNIASLPSNRKELKDRIRQKKTTLASIETNIQKPTANKKKLREVLAVHNEDLKMLEFKLSQLEESAKELTSRRLEDDTFFDSRDIEEVDDFDEVVRHGETIREIRNPEPRYYDEFTSERIAYTTLKNGTVRSTGVRDRVPARPISVEEAERVKAEFLADLNHNLDIAIEIVDDPKKISQDPEWLRKYGRAQGYIADTREYRGQYTIVVFPGNNGSAEEVRRTLRHEVLAHFGIAKFWPSNIKRDILRAIRLSRHSSLSQEWRLVERAYPDSAPDVQAEEVLALIAEDLPSRTIWADIKNYVIAILRKAGLLKGVVTRVELEAMLRSIAEAYRRGQRGNPDPVVTQDVFRRLKLSEALAGVTPYRVGLWTKSLLNGLKKATLPMFTGLYQLSDISPALAWRFRRYFQAEADVRNLWLAEWQKRVVDQMSPEQVNRAIQELIDRGETQNLDGLSRDALYIRQFLDRFYRQYAKKHMKTLGRIDNYVPQLYNLESVESRGEEFIEVLTKHTIAGSAGRISERSARKIRQTLLENGGGYEYAIEEFLNAVGPGFDSRKARMLRSPALIAELEEKGFLYPDKGEMITHYIASATKRGAFEHTFGGYREIRGWTQALADVRKLEIITDRLHRAGVYDPNHPSSGDLRALVRLAKDFGYAREAEDGRLSWYTPSYQADSILQQLPHHQGQRAKEIIDGFMGRFGARIDPDTRRWMSGVMVYESYLTLAFSTLSSLPDFAGPFMTMIRQRGVGEAWQVFKHSLTTLSKPEHRVELKRQAEQVGLINQRLSLQALREMYGQAHTTAFAQKALDKLFHYNGQEWLTGMSRMYAWETGKYFLQRLARDNDGLLSDYHLTAEEVNRWFEADQPTWTAELEETNPQTAELAKKVQRALYQFVDESIIRPNAGQRPVWASDPRFMLLWHLKSFFWSYWSVIVAPMGRHVLKTFQDGIRTGDYKQAASAVVPVVAAALMLLPLAAVGWELRELIQYNAFGKRGRTDRMDGWQYTSELVSRAGVLGPFELALDIVAGNGEIDDRTMYALGPAIQHLNVLLNGEWDTKVYRSIPLLNQLPGLKSQISD